MMFSKGGNIHEKVWGREEWIVNNELYCCKFLYIKPRYQCSLHFHKLKTETFYLIRGKVWLSVQGYSGMMIPGDSITIYPSEQHIFVGETWFRESILLEVSTQHFEEDSYRITKSKKVEV